MSVARSGRAQHRWHCWHGDQGQLERVLAAFDAATRSGAGDAAVTTRMRGERDGGPRSLRAVADDADVGRLAEVSIAAPAARGAPEDVWLELSRARGVVLKGGPGSFETARAVDAAIRPAIAVGVPWWSWLHSGLVEVVLALVMGALLEVAWLSASGRLGDAEPGLVAGSLAVGVIVAYALLRALHLVFPRFTVRVSPPSSSGRT
jgi:hypothetical protein